MMMINALLLIDYAFADIALLFSVRKWRRTPVHGPLVFLVFDLYIILLLVCSWL